MLNKATTFGLNLSAGQLEQFQQYQQMLLDWNQRVNLTRIIDPAEIAVKHFLDSLSVHQSLPRTPFSLIDVGSGAGFPGIPLKIARPDIRLTLLESTTKKTQFLTHVVAELGLSDSHVLTARVEDAGQNRQHRQRYDVAIARAVGHIAVLVEYMLPLLKIGGLMIAQKGQDPTAEVNETRWAIGMVGGGPPQLQALTVPGLDAARHIVIIKKKRDTPKQYPRRAGIPAKQPLIQG